MGKVGKRLPRMLRSQRWTGQGGSVLLRPPGSARRAEVVRPRIEKAHPRIDVEVAADAGAGLPTGGPTPKPAGLRFREKKARHATTTAPLPVAARDRSPAPSRRFLVPDC